VIFQIKSLLPIFSIEILVPLPGVRFIGALLKAGYLNLFPSTTIESLPPFRGF
jgi:hypothetical protein